MRLLQAGAAVCGVDAAGVPPVSLAALHSQGGRPQAPPHLGCISPASRLHLTRISVVSRQVSLAALHSQTAVVRLLRRSNMRPPFMYARVHPHVYGMYAHVHPADPCMCGRGVSSRRRRFIRIPAME